MLDFTGYYLSKAWKATKHGMKHVFHGLVQISRDGKWIVRQKHGQFVSKYSDVSYMEHKKIRQVKKDFIKFVPFSFFILIPGGEILLPAWIMIFPNSIPSQFATDDDRRKKFMKLKD